MTADINITTATVKDVDTLHKWGEEHWELWADELYKWFSKSTLTKWFKDPGNDVLLIARHNGVPIGMCLVHPMYDWAMCWGLFVEEAYRGKGIGKQLLEEARHRLKPLHVRSVSLIVDTKNERATKFYEREGFYKGYSFYFMTKDLQT